MKENVLLNSIEDLVRYTLAEKYRATERYQLEENYRDVWVDEEEGEAWEKRYEDLGGYVSVSSPDRIKYDALMDEKPDTKRKTCYYLIRANSSWRSSSIDLSKELGEMIDNIWTKRPAYRGANYQRRVGMISLLGILKRLGNTDIGDKVAAAQKAEKELGEKRARNYDRKKIREKAQELYSLLTSSDVVDWDMSKDKNVYFLSRLDQLTRILDEE